MDGRRGCRRDVRRTRRKLSVAAFHIYLQKIRCRGSRCDRRSWRHHRLPEAFEDGGVNRGPVSVIAYMRSSDLTLTGSAGLSIDEIPG